MINENTWQECLTYIAKKTFRTCQSLATPIRRKSCNAPTMVHMASKTRSRKTTAAKTLAQMGQHVWHIQPDALMQVQSAVSLIAERGIDAQSFAAVHDSASNIIPASEYSRRVERAGSTAIIPVLGVIEPESGFYTRWLGGTNCAQIRSDFRTALADSTVETIYMVIDSPGGIAMGLAETAELIAEVAAKKKVVAYCRNMTASAAYYLATSATEIIATQSTAVGSVGTIIGHFSYAGMLEEVGIKYTQITFGANKGEGSPYMDLDDKSRSGLQAFVDSYGTQFVNHVAQQRGVTVSEVNERFGQGRVFIAAEALERKMIDGIGMLENSLTAGGSGSVITPGGKSSGLQSRKEPPNVKKLVALLYAMNLVSSLEASAEVVDAAVGAWCAARGVDVPRNDAGEIDETKTIKLIQGGQSAPASASNNASAPATTKPEQSGVDQLAAYKERRDEIRAIAAGFNAGRPSAMVSQSDIDAAIDGKLSVKEISEKWATKLEQSDDGQPTNTGTVSFGPAGEEKFVEASVNALASRMGCNVSADIPRDMRNISLFEVGQRCAQMTGMRIAAGTTREDQAMAILCANPQPTSMSGGSFNRPGDFANVLSALAGKILDDAMMLAETTFERWTQRMMDVPDFKPKTVMRMGLFDNLDLVEDGEASKQLQMQEELGGWFMTETYGNHVKLTPRMLADDDLDAFNQQLISLAMAHDITLNTLCLDLLAGNVTLVDGTALFHADHANLVSSGGAPSATQAKANKLLHRRQTAVGTTRTINSYPRVVLVPSALEDAAQQTYYSIAQLAQMAGGESKVANADSSINVHRGSVSDVVVEPGLESYTTGDTYWYTFDNRLRTIVHGFQSGYGRGGKRTTWFSNENKCRVIDLEGRFGAAAVGYRGVVRNNGA